MLENKSMIYDRFVCFQLREAAWFYFMSKIVELLDTVSNITKLQNNNRVLLFSIIVWSFVFTAILMH